MDSELIFSILIVVLIAVGILMYFKTDFAFKKAIVIEKNKQKEEKEFTPPIISINKGLEEKKVKYQRMERYNLHHLYNPNVTRDEKGRYSSLKNVAHG